MEKKVVHTTKDSSETTIKGCREGNYGVVCVTDMTVTNGTISIPIYKAIKRKNNEIYENLETARTDEIDLLKLFGMERAN